jgi:flagellar biosynthesis protein FliP
MSFNIDWLFGLLFTTSFLGIFTVLSILRLGLGLTQTGFGLVVFVLSCALSLVQYQKLLEELPDGENSKGKLTNPMKLDFLQTDHPFTPLLLKRSDPKIVKQVKSFSSNNSDSKSVTTFPISFASFVLTQIKIAFYTGILFLVPFLIIDLITAMVFYLLGFSGSNLELYTTATKVVAFTFFDGWSHITQKLMTVYA